VLELDSRDTRFRAIDRLAVRPALFHLGIIPTRTEGFLSSTSSLEPVHTIHPSRNWATLNPHGFNSSIVLVASESEWPKLHFRVNVLPARIDWQLSGAIERPRGTTIWSCAFLLDPSLCATRTAVTILLHVYINSLSIVNCSLIIEISIFEIVFFCRWFISWLESWILDCAHIDLPSFAYCSSFIVTRTMQFIFASNYRKYIREFYSKRTFPKISLLELNEVRW